MFTQGMPQGCILPTYHAGCQAVPMLNFWVLRFVMPKEKQTTGKGLLALLLVYNGVRT